MNDSNRYVLCIVLLESCRNGSGTYLNEMKWRSGLPCVNGTCRPEIFVLEVKCKHKMYRDMAVQAVKWLAMDWVVWDSLDWLFCDAVSSGPFVTTYLASWNLPYFVPFHILATHFHFNVVFRATTCPTEWTYTTVTHLVLIWKMISSNPDWVPAVLCDTPHSFLSLSWLLVAVSTSFSTRHIRKSL